MILKTGQTLRRERMKSIVAIRVSTDDLIWEASQWGIKLSIEKAKDILKEMDELSVFDNYTITMIRRELTKIFAERGIKPKHFKV